MVRPLRDLKLRLHHPHSFVFMVDAAQQDHRIGVEQLNETITSPQTAIQTKDSEIDNMTSNHWRQLGNVRNALEAEAEKTKEAQQALEDRERIIAALNAKIAELEQENATMRRTYKDDIKVARASASDAADHEAKANIRVEDLEPTPAQLHRALEEKTDIQVRLATSEAQLNAAVQDHAAVVGQKDKTIAEANEQIGTLNKELAHHESENTRLANQVKKLAVRVSAKSNQIFTLLSEITSANTTITTLKDDLDTTRTSASAVELKTKDQVEELQARISQVDIELQAAVMENKELAAHNADSKTVISIQSKNISDLNAQLQVAENDKAAVQARLSTSAREVDSTKGLLDAALKERDTIVRLRDNKIAEAEKQVETLSAELVNQQEENARLAGQVEQMTSTIVACKKEILNVEASLVSAEDELDFTKAQLEAGARKDGKAEEQINALTAESAHHQAECARLASQVEQVMGKLTAKDAQISILSSTLATATTRVSELEARQTPPATSDDSDETRTEVDETEATPVLGLSPLPSTTSPSLGRTQSMTVSPKSSPPSAARRHSLSGSLERSKQGDLQPGAEVKEDDEAGVAEQEDAVEAALVAEPEFPSISVNGAPEEKEDRTVEAEVATSAIDNLFKAATVAPQPPQGLSQSIWAPTSSNTSLLQRLRPGTSAINALFKVAEEVVAEPEVALKPQGLSQSKWAPKTSSPRPLQAPLPARPQVGEEVAEPEVAPKMEGLAQSIWATRGASPRPQANKSPKTPKSRNRGKSKAQVQSATSQSIPEGSWKGQGPPLEGTQSFAEFNSAERVSSGRAGKIPTTKSMKDARQVSDPRDFLLHDDR
ncbi:hypothetical protein FRB90_004658 [Tulasnella sp. 427]|nr:hypothetical protein FRB90_004658 [Tulasnella sp. 427]